MEADSPGAAARALGRHLMARIRSIKPEFWTDSFMVQLPPLARLIYIALWTAADDHGLIPDEPERLAMEVMPKEDGLVFDDWMQLFEASGRIDLFAAEDGSTFYRIAKWLNHQRVDKPSKSRIFREGSRKVAIPLETRRKVATKYGCQPGETVDAQCYYCGAFGQVHWHRLFGGRPSAWVTFPGLELDHLEAEVHGGSGAAGNVVLACRGCNRSKGSKQWIEHLCAVNSVPVGLILQSPREDSCTERNREEEQGRGRGTGTGTGRGTGSLRSPLSSAPPTTDLLGTQIPKTAEPPSDLGARRAQRIASVTEEAIAAYNASLGKPVGKLASVNPKVGRKKRQEQVQRSLQTASEICDDQFGDKKITPEFWDSYFAACSDDDFHNGTGPYSGAHANWRPDFEYLTRPATMLKVFERATDQDAAA